MTIEVDVYWVMFLMILFIASSWMTSWIAHKLGKIEGRHEVNAYELRYEITDLKFANGNLQDNYKRDQDRIDNLINIVSNYEKQIKAIREAIEE